MNLEQDFSLKWKNCVLSPDSDFSLKHLRAVNTKFLNMLKGRKNGLQDLVLVTQIISNQKTQSTVILPADDVSIFSVGTRDFC